jgi:hypothetical protein
MALEIGLSKNVWLEYHVIGLTDRWTCIWSQIIATLFEKLLPTQLDYPTKIIALIYSSGSKCVVLVTVTEPKASGLESEPVQNLVVIHPPLWKMVWLPLITSYQTFGRGSSEISKLCVTARWLQHVNLYGGWIFLHQGTFCFTHHSHPCNAYRKYFKL